MVDEYNTFCLHHITEVRFNNLQIKWKDNKIRKLHSVLTFKGENERKGCINRDNNATHNICKLVEAELRGQSRPVAFSLTRT